MLHRPMPHSYGGKIEHRMAVIWGHKPLGALSHDGVGAAHVPGGIGQASTVSSVPGPHAGCGGSVTSGTAAPAIAGCEAGEDGGVGALGPGPQAADGVNSRRWC
jgi:hypothetical protein